MTAPTTAQAQDITGLGLLQLARRIGIAYIDAGEANDRYKQVKASEERVLAEARRRGIPSVEIVLPGGAKAAVIPIQQGAVTWEWDTDQLEITAAGNDPRDFEDFVEPRAWSDPRVIRLIAEHYPDLVGRQLRPAVAANYKQEAQDHDGKIADRRTGEMVTIGTSTRYDPTGAFSVRFTPKGRQLLRDALDSGALNELGESDDDQPDQAAAEMDALLSAPAGHGGDIGDGGAAGEEADGAHDRPGGLYFDEDGCFHSPEAAAAHAIQVQGGYSTPAREARRMVADGHRAGVGPETVRQGAMALAWLDERGLSSDGDDEPDSAASLTGDEVSDGLGGGETE